MLNVDLDLLKDQYPSHWLSCSYNWDNLTKGLNPVFYEKGQLIFQLANAYDFVYIVNKGSVTLSTLLENGEEYAYSIIEKGCTFGELAVLSSTTDIYTATASEGTYLYKVPKELFVNEFLTNLEFNNNLVKLLVKKVRQRNTQIKLLTFNDARYRTCYLLVSLAINYSIPLANGHRITKKFTQEELAMLTGTSRVSVSTVCSSLNKEGFLSKRNGFYIVKHLSTLINYLNKNQVYCVNSVDI